MYKILIKPNPTQKYYTPYKVTLESGDSVEYSAETVDEVAEEYKTLLQKYTMAQLKVVQELEPELLVTIVD